MSLVSGVPEGWSPWTSLPVSLELRALPSLELWMNWACPLYLLESAAGCNYQNSNEQSSESSSQESETKTT